MTTATTHPDPESLAAFADGRLAGAERVTVIEHLARCEDCLDVVAETGAVQEELQEELEEDQREDELSLPGGAFDPGLPRRAGPENVLLHPRRKWWLAAAASLAAAVALALVGVRWMDRYLSPDLSVDRLAERLKDSAERLEPDAWADHGRPVFRGDEIHSQGQKKASFRAGVHAVDLQVALRSGRREPARLAVEALVETLADLATAGPMKGVYEDKVLEPLQGADPALRRIDIEAAASDASLQMVAKDPFYRFGKWAEAGRLAARAGDRGALRSRHMRRALEEFLQVGLEEGVHGRLLEIRDRLGGALSDDDLQRLATDFRSIVGGDGVRLQREPPALSTEPAEE